MNKSIFFICMATAVFLCRLRAGAQSADSTATWSLSAYTDVYYAYYTDSRSSGQFQQFPTVSPRSNSFSLNVLQGTAEYDGSHIRALAIVHAGDIPASAWSGQYNAIQEAHVGVKLLKTLWLDAGFFKTHLGTEFLMPKDNITSSVTMLTYYEPYYESGLRLNWDPTSKLEINLFLLNGYNTFVDNNSKKSLGLGVTYLLGDKGNIGYTNYLGDDSPEFDSLPHLRFDNNAFINYKFGPRFSIQAGGDLCFQQNADIATGRKEAMAYGWLATGKYQFLPKCAVYARAAVFNDPEGFLSAVYTDAGGLKSGYQEMEGTLGLEYKPIDNGYIRIEGRKIQMAGNQDIFSFNGQALNYRYEAMVNMGFYFDLAKGAHKE